MKKSILILLFFITLDARAQGNLQFNRVVNFSVSQTVGADTLITFQTFQVPAGKVWKIENVNVGQKRLSGYPEACEYCTATFNEIIAFMRQNQVTDAIFPIWLSEGSYNFKIGSYPSPSRLISASYSAIEFNVIP